MPAAVEDLRDLPEEEVLARAATADGILLGARFKLDRERIEQLQRCRVVVRYGVGVDNVDLETASACGIVVSYVPDYCVEEVSNHAIALLLALHRQLSSYNQQARSGRIGIDSARPIPRLSGLALGIVGFGRIGRAVARKAQAFGLHVLAFDPVIGAGAMERANVEPAALDELLARADAVSLHVPLSNQTCGLLGAERLAEMKPGSLLINVGRGGLVDEAALADALRSGHLGGAGLDVTTLEPLPAGHPLLALPNVILTPHVAWYSTGAQRELQTKAAEEIGRVLSGMPALNALR